MEIGKEGCIWVKIMISSKTISDVYPLTLADTLNSRFRKPLVQVTEVLEPIKEDEIFRKQLDKFIFPDGRSGEWWIEDRLKALLTEKGEYWARVHENGKFDYVVSALQGMTRGSFPRWNANRLVIPLFKDSDLHKSRMPIPPCLISLDFHPIRDKLTLVGIFRAQYTDAKGYGNILSLCYLLKHVCDETGFKPDRVYNVVNKPILKYSESVVRRFLYALQ